MLEFSTFVIQSVGRLVSFLTLSIDFSVSEVYPDWVIKIYKEFLS